MINVGRDDCTASGKFGAYEFRRDLAWSGFTNRKLPKKKRRENRRFSLIGGLDTLSNSRGLAGSVDRDGYDDFRVSRDLDKQAALSWSSTLYGYARGTLSCLDGNSIHYDALRNVGGHSDLEAAWRSCFGDTQ